MEIKKLQKDGELISSLDHKHIMQFLQKTIEKKVTWIYKIYIGYIIVLSILFFAITGWSFYQFIDLKDISPLYPSLIGILFSLTFLIVIHELIHALVYKLVGGKNIYFGSNFKQFVFYAASDKHVYNGKDFFKVAIAPFLVFNIIGILMCVFNVDWIPFVVTVLCVHMYFCSGDFAFLNYMLNYNLNDFYTYDCRETQTSFYYILTQ